MSVEKSAGSTESERVLARLCNDTFLGFWSYPNVYRDQGPKGLYHELVDLLVVIGNDIILFSDKLCQFPAIDCVNTAWIRWYKRAVQRSAEQLFGAERWIREHPERLFLDPACQQRLPLPIDHVGECRFHRIVVASGAKDACQRSLGGSGSLVLAPEIQGPDHIQAENPNFKPFFVGTVMPKKGWVHVVDDVTLPLILHELDTIADFLAYLKAKEHLLLTDGLKPVISGEENLLATFLANDGADWSAMAADISKKGAGLIVADEIWDHFRDSPSYRQRRTAGDDSRRVWDRMIQEFATHTFGGTLIKGSASSVEDNEVIFRILASEPRRARAFLTHQMLERCLLSEPDRAAFRVVSSPTHPDTGYAFGFFPCKRRNDQRHRAYRQREIVDYALTVAYRHREFRRVVAIATEMGNFPYRTYDVFLQEINEWTPALEQSANRKLVGLELFPDGPDDPVPPARPKGAEVDGKIRRNDLCPCGSGKKFKKCCMRRTE
jgi:SEC-C motif